MSDGTHPTKGGRFAVISGGGTGGHVLQGLAIARALVDRGHSPGSIEMVGSARGQEADLLAGEDFGLTLLPGRGLARRWDPEALVANAEAVWGLARATARELVDLARGRPRVVVSVGGYASFPADLAAVVLGVPLVLVNIDAVPGLVHRLLGRWAAASAVSFPGTPLPRAEVTGTAVRQSIAAVGARLGQPSEVRRSLGLPPDRVVVGVVGGSLGARRINLAVVELARRWADRPDVAIYHVTGRRDWEEVERLAAGIETGSSYLRVPFERDMAAMYEAVDVMVCRAGAVTVAELAVTGTPAVLVPLPGAPGNHQEANARALVEADAAVLLPDRRCDAAGLEHELEPLLHDPARRAAMARAAQALGRPDAAERVAELVEAHAR